MKYQATPAGEEWDEEFWEAVKGLNRLCLKEPPVEGNAFYWHKGLKREDQPADQRLKLRRQTLARLARGRVLEVGVNGGHSALLMLAAGAEEYWGVDTGAHGYTAPAVAFLRERGFNAQVVLGDSSRALPVLIAEEIGPFDLVHIDGGHDLAGALADLLNARWLVASDGVVLVDDMQIPKVREAVERMIGGNWYTGSIGDDVAELRLA